MQTKQEVIKEFVKAVHDLGTAPPGLQLKLANLFSRRRGRPSKIWRLAALETAMVIREFHEPDDTNNKKPTVDEVIREFVGDDPDGKQFEAVRKAWYNKSLHDKLRKARENDPD